MRPNPLTNQMLKKRDFFPRKLVSLITFYYFKTTNLFVLLHTKHHVLDNTDLTFAKQAGY